MKLFLAKILAELYFFINYLWVKTLRIQYINDESVWGLKKQGKSILLAQFHSNTFVSFYVYRNRNAVIFVADNFKGLVLGEFAKKYGYQTLAMNEDDESLFSKKQIVKFIKHLRGGGDGVVAWDGPQGPKGFIKPGAAFIANQAKAVLVRINIAYHTHIKLFWRWDQYEIPLPFSRVTVVSTPDLFS